MATIGTRLVHDGVLRRLFVVIRVSEATEGDAPFQEHELEMTDAASQLSLQVNLKFVDTEWRTRFSNLDSEWSPPIDQSKRFVLERSCLIDGTSRHVGHFTHSKNDSIESNQVLLSFCLGLNARDL